MHLITDKPKRKGLNFTHYERTKKNKPLEEFTVVRLYDTHVLIAEQGQIKLNSGGFKTNHTKNVINDFLPMGYKVYQENFTWYVKCPDGGSLTFEDDMIIKVEV